jgi:hypothetical protein
MNFSIYWKSAETVILSSIAWPPLVEEDLSQTGLSDLEEWVINLDGGPAVRSDRTRIQETE